MLGSKCAFAPLLIVAAAYAGPVQKTADFNRDIRPLFSDRCFTCHGPDQAKRKSRLRLDTEAGARIAIAPGDPANSELIRRITTDDPARRMPPVWSGAQKLAPREIEALTKWIAEGAEWQKHWSFIPLQRPALPEVRNAAWPRNSIDRFVLAKLDREGLQPSPEADRRTLIRRVSLDLTGLPPTPGEVSAFLADASPNAYETVVDRLLASPHYGERMAARWLDAARYADTNGYQTDGERSMWRWRDWVIEAFNRNTPYNEFALEQIAGDLLPNARLPQILATGFNRNHRGNGEGGIIADEYAVEYVVDRVETNSTVWLGLTLGCARCHNHKYDPLTQKEFYQVFAYFNNVPERGKAFKYGNSPPVIPAPTVAQEAKLAAFDATLAGAENNLNTLAPAIAKAQRAWEIGFAQTAQDWSPTRNLAVHLPLNGDLKGEINPDPPRSEKYVYLMENGPVKAKLPLSDTLEPAWKEDHRYVEVGNVANFGFYDSFTMSAWINPTSGNGCILSRAKDEADGQGISLCLKDSHLQANLVQRWLDDGGRVESERGVDLNRWSHVMLTYDGTRVAGGIKLYLNGEPLKVKTQLDDLNQSFDTKEPLRIGAGLGKRFDGTIREVLIYRAALNVSDAAVLGVAETPARIARIAPDKRTVAQSEKLRRCFVDRYASSNIRDAHARVEDLRAEREKLIASYPTVMVMQENAVPRETHLLLRGAYDHPGDKVTPGVPAVLPPLPPGAPNNRLGFARWVVDPANPLTARVAVNRFWQMYFGTGIVKTVEDFGSQGEAPSNPELLDWLATEFVSTGWDIKALQKTIVLSATYRQSSKATPEMLQRDPENRLFLRGPRVRLPAEIVRDQALALAGLLVPTIGGPSVKPYQPAGLWKELSGGEDYHPDTGDGLHRRSLYTYWKRTSPPPMMMNFDSAGREACTVREVRTNTPLQSLNLMNDVTFLEAARVVAERAMRDGGQSPSDRIGFVFSLATSRPPKPREQEVLLNSFRYYSDLFQTDPASALKYLNQGAAKRDSSLPPSELAAYSAVASLILNLDELVTKQ